MAAKKKTSTKTEAKTPSKRKTTKKAVAETTLKQPAQPEINIGIIGHVDHGKTTLVQTLSGKWADTHSEEIKRGITIRLGYADVSFYKCSCEENTYTVKPICEICGKETTLLRKISLVDAPGHESLMATMLCGANIMDGAILMISANETCPQPQTREHLQALEIIGITKLIIIQNKIDLVDETEAQKNYQQIKNFLKNTPYTEAPILPMSAKHGVNLDMLIKTIEELVPTPERNLAAKPIMYIARSFDVNKPGTTPQKIIGGVIGGSLKQGKLTTGQEIEILPGYSVQERNQQVWKPFKTKITKIMAGNTEVQEATPGGTFALLTQLDPSVVKSDKLVGSTVTTPGNSPPVWQELKLQTKLLERVVGAKDKLVVEPIKQSEMLMLNVNAAATVGIVKDLSKNIITCSLKRPVCAEKGSQVTIGRNVGQRWRLIGYGNIV
ncbi:translation initiation factor IF-2 subunit gamma [Candidatus Woesearchaeota archaeon CG10_big_fil_rev_8_21_14_0_10_37_12]|nr:MAG: translation initiation factor IF-2 subunit gamma [Candidatus Woesearchaeota archaeon CG10_big_fil_rev_8_21_14_0_10_37_12]